MLGDPPLDFLLSCSPRSAASFELDRLNRLANLRKELRAVSEELLRVEAEAMLARWLLDNKDTITRSESIDALQKSLEFSYIKIA